MKNYKHKRVDIFPDDLYAHCKDCGKILSWKEVEEKVKGNETCNNNTSK